MNLKSFEIIFTGKIKGKQNIDINIYKYMYCYRTKGNKTVAYEYYY